MNYNIKKQLQTFLAILLLLSKNHIESAILKNDTKSCLNESSVNFTKLLHLKSDISCCQIIILSNETYPPWVFKMDTQITYFIRTYDELINENVNNYSAKVKENCNVFIIVSKEYSRIMSIFSRIEMKKRFYPMTKVFLLSEFKPVLSFNDLLYLNENTIHLYWIEFWPGNCSVQKAVNCLTNKALDLNRYDEEFTFGRFSINHPFFDTEQFSGKTKVFRASFYHCPPYVIFNGKR